MDLPFQIASVSSLSYKSMVLSGGRVKSQYHIFVLPPFLVGLAAVVSGEAVTIKTLDNKTLEAFVSS
jgi:hypothetical protein